MQRKIPLVATALSVALATPVFAQEPADASGKRADLIATASEAGQFQTLIAAAQAAGLTDTLKDKGPFTIFAPNDAAFEALPEGALEELLENTDELAKILKYHVVQGEMTASQLKDKDWVETLSGQSLRVAEDMGNVTIDGAKVLKADIRAKNGVIHVIDKVVMPRENIVKIAEEAGFGTLCKCVKAAGLDGTLAEKGPFTVFAPTDAAFDAIPKEELAALMQDKSKLKGILTYHVVPGRVLSSDIPESKDGKPSAEPKTVQGDKLEIVRDGRGNVTVNGVRVIRTDIVAGNGVIHVVEGVVMPK